MSREKRTYADRRETLIRAVAKRRRTLKVMAIEYKGGKCILCGYSRIDKCVLLCANCHREVNAGITQLPAERRDEKRGELLEVLLSRSRKKDNQQPSPAPVLKTGVGKVQRLSRKGVADE